MLKKLKVKKSLDSYKLSHENLPLIMYNKKDLPWIAWTKSENFQELFLKPFIGQSIQDKVHSIISKLE